MTFHTNNTERMRIDSSGDVRIGSITNAYGFAQKLRVGDGNDNDGITINSGSTHQGNLAFCHGSGGNTAFGRISYQHNSNYMQFFTNNTERVRISSTGAFFLYGIIGFSGANSDVRYYTSTGQIYYQSSSERYKSEITNLEDSLNKIESLRPVRFKDNHTEEYTIGLIAEEVVDIIPEVVFKKDIDGFDEQQPEGINYSDITPFLIKAIQEQKELINNLTSRIEELEN